ncbi:MAG: DUF1499 domain-containing protein [Pseudohongiella sp.]|nr:DUF1499 domain-containing protein [Pseudohongiella sp.]MDP2126997.1 DUF1499 domain-containing protein [Pseudohongiella sp.]
MNTGSQNTLGTVLKIVAALAGLAGIGLALIALAAPVGVWLGLWDFRQGFSMLRSAQPYVMWITIGCAVATVLLLGLGKRAHLHNSGTLIKIAGAATIAAAIAWYIPNSYLPGSGAAIPPIHDISTDTVNPPAFVDVLPLRGTTSNPTVYGTGNAQMTPEVHAQRQREAYPDVVTQVFSEPADQVFARALAAVNTLGWDLVAQVPAEGRIEATDTTFWFRFKDDVVIRITESPEGTLLDARSTSRVGVSDVGKNAARLRAFFAAL